MGNKSLIAVDRSSSILDRASPTQNQPLTEAQALTDRLVSVSIEEGTSLKTATAMLGAGWVGRFTRIGAMTSLPGQAFARGASYAPALAAESAAFAGIERGFHPTSQPFQKDWARAAVTLTGLKAFGGMSRGQNIVLQHLFTDLGLVGGNKAASMVGLMDRPQGNFTQQMLQAEATNWHMKGSMAFAHSFSPRLSASEKSLEIFLKSQETNLFPEEQSSPFFSQLAIIANGGRRSFSVSHGEANEWKMASKKDEGGGSGEGKVSGKIGEIQKSPDPSSEKEGSLDGLTPGANERVIAEVFKGLMEKAESGDKKIREEAISKLMEFAKDGAKDTALADVLHKRAMNETDAAHMKQGSYERAMELEWAAARACPVGLEPSRGVLYRSAVMLALTAEKPEKASWIIREALREDSKGVAESEIRRSAEELEFLDLKRKFIFDALEEGKRAAESMKMRLAIWGPSSWKSEKTPEDVGFPNRSGHDGAWLKDKDPEQRNLTTAALAKHVVQEKEGKTGPGVEKESLPSKVLELVSQGYRLTKKFTESSGKQLNEYRAVLNKSGIDYRLVMVHQGGVGPHNARFDYFVLESEKSGSTTRLEGVRGSATGDKPLPKAVQDVISQGYQVTKLFTTLNGKDLNRYTRGLKKKNIDYRVVPVCESGQALHNAYFLYYVLEKSKSGSEK